MIADLEDETKMPLLQRSKQGVVMTSSGIELFPYAVKLCQEFDKLQMKIDDMNGIQSGMIRIGTFSSVATHWLPNIIAAFEKDYPNIEYELLLGDYEEIEKWISEGRVDFGFLRLPTNKSFDCIEIEKDQQMVVLPQSHPFAEAKMFPVEELKNYPFIMLEKGIKAEITDIFLNNKIVPNPKFTTFDDYAVMSMVEKGLGIAFNVCKNAEDAEDVVQDTCIQYHTTKKAFENEQHIRAWLIRVAINKAKNMNRMYAAYDRRRNSLRYGYWRNSIQDSTVDSWRTDGCRCGV